jgi:hypothetical protein
LEQASHALSKTLYQSQARPGAASPGPEEAGPKPAGEEDAIDAEFEVKDSK